MRKALFLLCPTDCLETTIHNAFSCESYFYTSLGNSFVYDAKTLESIKTLIMVYKISHIYFVLSDDNQIILDALGKQYFSDIRGLKGFYKKVEKQKEHSELMWVTDNNQNSILSYLLNDKIRELQFDLRRSLRDNPVKISGKIYNRLEDTFRNIFSNLTCLDKHYLN